MRRGSFSKKKLVTEKSLRQFPDVESKTLNGDLLQLLPLVPDEFADLIIVDPPYNLSKIFNGLQFNSMSQKDYQDFLNSWFPLVCKKLKPTGSLYLCGDWKCTAALQQVLEQELTVLNRITWQREKGRGAKSNWKNDCKWQKKILLFRAMEMVFFGKEIPFKIRLDKKIRLLKKVCRLFQEQGYLEQYKGGTTALGLEVIWWKLVYRCQSCRTVYTLPHCRYKLPVLLLQECRLL